MSLSGFFPSCFYFFSIPASFCSFLFFVYGLFRASFWKWPLRAKRRPKNGSMRSRLSLAGPPLSTPTTPPLPPQNTCVTCCQDVDISPLFLIIELGARLLCSFILILSFAVSLHLSFSCYSKGLLANVKGKKPDRERSKSTNSTSAVSLAAGAVGGLAAYAPLIRGLFLFIYILRYVN